MTANACTSGEFPMQCRASEGSTGNQAPAWLPDLGNSRFPVKSIKAGVFKARFPNWSLGNRRKSFCSSFNALSFTRKAFCLSFIARSLARKSFCVAFNAQSLAPKSFCFAFIARSLAHKAFWLAFIARSLARKALCVAFNALILARQSFCVAFAAGDSIDKTIGVVGPVSNRTAPVKRFE